MTRTLSLFVALLLAIAGTLTATSAQAQAQEEPGTFDIKAKFRARIAKEKAKQAATQASTAQGSNGSGDSPQCGAQNIGNVDTNGRIGSGPREVFVFAPNAINTVNNGCN